MITGEVGQARPCVLGCLEQAGDHERQEEADVLAIGLKRSQLALLLVQATLERGPYVLELGIGKPGQGDELSSAFPAEPESREYALDVGSGREHLARLDL